MTSTSPWGTQRLEGGRYARTAERQRARFGQVEVDLTVVGAPTSTPTDEPATSPADAQPPAEELAGEPMSVGGAFTASAMTSTEPLEPTDLADPGDAHEPATPTPEPAVEQVDSYLVVQAPLVTRGATWLRTDDASSRLGQWAGEQPRGLWWSEGLWTDRFPLPVGVPIVGGARTMGLATPTDARSRWARLRGQRHGDQAWVIALDDARDVICQWVVNLTQVQALLDVLVAPGYPWPGDGEWFLDRPGAQPPTPELDVVEAHQDEAPELVEAAVEPGTGTHTEETYTDEW